MRATQLQENQITLRVGTQEYLYGKTHRTNHKNRSHRNGERGTRSKHTTRKYGHSIFPDFSRLIRSALAI